MSAHSPGPWRWDQRIGDWHGKDEVLWDADGRPLVCETLGHRSSPMQAADARLIAAAPELLAALRRYLESPDVNGVPDIDDDARALRALIARIEGGK